MEHENRRYSSKYQNDQMHKTVELCKTLLERIIRFTLEFLSFTLADKIRNRELTSENLVRSYIERAKQADETLNVVVEDCSQKAPSRAGEMDYLRKDLWYTKPFQGVPFSITESIGLVSKSHTGGIKTRSATKARKTNPAVERLIDAGMIPLVLTNTSCMNLCFDNYNLLHGRTRNPYDLSRIAGGSSGGEAALIAATGSIVGVGSDLGGSMRLAANFCGIFAHKPTPSTVSTFLSYPACHKERNILNGVGPMTRYACDLLPMLKIMVEEKHRERLCLDEQVDLSKIEVYFCEDLGDPLTSPCNQYVSLGLRQAVDHLATNFGIPVMKIEFPEFRFGLSLWSAAAEDGKVYCPHPEGLIHFNPFVELIKCLFGSSMLTFNSIFWSLMEKFGPKNGTSKQQHLKDAGQKLRARFNALLGTNGVLVMPTFPEPSPYHSTTIFKYFNHSYTAVADILHAPITQCPIGLSREGMPIGVQIIAAPYNDRYTLAVAREFERAFGGWVPPQRAGNATSSS